MEGFHRSRRVNLRTAHIADETEHKRKALNFHHDNNLKRERERERESILHLILMVLELETLYPRELVLILSKHI